METSRGGLTGTVLDGRYRVGAVIARGGMSTVYRGTDLRLDRPVAIKVMSPQYVTDPAFLTRFQREARIAAGLGHPGVVGVYDQGRDGEHVFLVMELVDGGTLRDLLREYGPLSVPVTLSVLEPLLAALGTAHAAGLVHRDIKPENVLISSKGEVKVADFGLVRAVTSQTMATGDVILGTVAYLSPEQVSTGAADTRSDVYAAGIVAWEMLTGRPPYTGDNPMSVAYQHVHSDIAPVSTGAPGVPEALEDLILAATRRDPLARPRDASAFLSALVGVRARLGLRRVPVPVPHREQPARTGGATVAARGAGPAGRPVAPAQGERSTAGGVAGPTGTRAVPQARAVTTAAPAPELRTPAEARWRRRWYRRLIVLVVLLLLAAAAAVGGWWLGSGRFAYAPVTVGLSRQAAESQVRSVGLVPRVREASDNVAVPGTVARTDPSPGTRLLRGSPVDLVVSTGRPVVPMISAGASPAQAAVVLRGSQLRTAAAALDIYDETVPIGMVIRTDPAAGQRVPINAVVKLVRSKGPRPIPVPTVAGKSVEDARNKLVVDGFRVAAQTREIFDATVEPGSVTGTEPAAGLVRPKGSQVTVLVAVSLTVPDVRGRSSQDADAQLAALGFTATVGSSEFDADVDSGAVIRTEPASGSRVDPLESDVTLVVSNAIQVPDLTDYSVSDAGRIASGLGLTLEVRSLFGTPFAPVVSQDPEPGSRVAPGSTVVVGAFG